MDCEWRTQGGIGIGSESGFIGIALCITGSCVNGSGSQWRNTELSIFHYLLNLTNSCSSNIQSDLLT